MKATRRILIYLSLVLITGLMIIPCAVKQQIKSSVTHTGTSTSAKTSTKTCVAIYTSLQQVQKKVERSAPPYPFAPSLPIYNIDYIQFVLSNNFALYFKEKVPTYILHCLFRI
mgnify:CR=1 FL=1